MSGQESEFIRLDFRDLEPSTCDLRGEDPLFELEFAFQGAQIFQIGEYDFSGDYPILAFAHALVTIAHHLKDSGLSAFYCGPYFTGNSRTEFSLKEDGATVIVKEVNRYTKEVLFSTSVSLEEFCNEADKYFNRVLSHCIQIYPELIDHKEVMEYLNSRPRVIPADYNPENSNNP